MFTTQSGKSFEGKAVGYEGQNFILSSKTGQLFQAPFNALSNADKAYLVEAVKAGRIPKGRPATTAQQKVKVLPKVLPLKG